MKQLKNIAKQQTFQKGEIIFQLGEKASNVFRVVSGEVHLYRIDEQGKRIIIYRAYENDYFAEASLLAGSYHCTASSLKTSTIESYPSTKVLALLQADQQFSMDWIAQLSVELRRQRSQVERLHIKSSADRIKHYLLTEGSPLGEISLKGTLSSLSEVLGITRESLYRTLATMEKQGVIDRGENFLRLL